MSMPADPFNNNGMDLTEFAANIRNMYTSLAAAGFSDADALEITIRFLISMVKK